MTTTRQRRRPRIPGPIQDRLEELLATTEWSAGQIWRQLEKEFGEKSISQRTVELWARELRTDDSAPWSVADAEDADEVALMLDVLREVTWESKGEVRHISRLEAEWIKRMHKAADGMSRWLLWRIAGVYGRREASSQTTGDLDDFIAYQPWKGTKESSAYEEAFYNQFVPRGSQVERWLEELREEK